MAWSWNYTSKIVRPRSTRHTPLLPCLLAFAATASLIYYWGGTKEVASQGRPIYSATAFVVEPSDKTLTEQFRIPITYTDPDPDYAKEAVDAMANCYVVDRLRESNQRAEWKLRKARTIVESAKQDLIRSESEFQQFQQRMAKKAVKARDEKPRAQTPAMADNPRWIDLDLQLSELEQRREKLLLDRTPLHPSVVDLTSQINDLKGQMAAIPQKIQSNEKPADNISPQTAETTPADNARTKQDHEKILALTAAVEKARKSLAAAETAAHALQDHQVAPQYAVVDAKAERITPMQPSDRRQLLWTTLVAGVLMAFGVGSISTGITIEPVAANAAQVQADAHMTVIGAMPAEDPIADPVKLSRRQMRDRQALMAIGLLLMAACPAVVLWGTLGI